MLNEITVNKNLGILVLYATNPFDVKIIQKRDEETGLYMLQITSDLIKKVSIDEDGKEI